MQLRITNEKAEELGKLVHETWLARAEWRIPKYVDCLLADRTDMLAEINCIKERSRLATAILVDALGASGPRNVDEMSAIAAAEIENLTAARDMAIKALGECSRAHGLEMGTLLSQLDESRREVSRLRTALHDIGWGTWGKSQRNAIETARGKARAALAIALEATNAKP